MLFGLKFHRPRPKWNNPGEMKFWTGSMGTSIAGNSLVTHRFTSHAIKKFWGVSYKRKWIIGFFVLGASQENTSPELPFYASDKDKEFFCQLSKSTCGAS